MDHSAILDSPQWRAAKLWLAAEGTQPPLLISGVNPDDLQNILKELALLAVCTTEGDIPCRKCDQCHRAIVGTHQDIISYTPAKLTIPIKDIRAILRQLTRTAVGVHRLIIINDIHKLSVPSANALLKAFEEPSVATRFILTTLWPKRLLPTILSRCQQLRFRSSHTGDQAAQKTTAAPWQQGLFQRLSAYDGKQVLDEETLNDIANALNEQMRQKGSTPELRRALLRLRDYYRITGTRGNERFARDVLLSSLPY